MDNNSAQNLNRENNVSQATQTPPVAPPQTLPPITKASKFSVKAIIGTIIFLLLAGGAAAGYVLREPILKLVSNPTPTPTVIPSQSKDPSPTPDPTANWKTYFNNDYNFSFKYPSEFNLEKEDKLDFVSTNFSAESITIFQYNLNFTNGRMVQYNTEYPAYKDRSYLGINIIPANGRSILEEYNDRQTNFGSTKVTHLATTGNADEVATVWNIENLIRVFRKGDIFVTIGSSQEGPGEIDKYRDQILSTFKFTD